jgi:DNA replication and repair protein RecF
VFLKEMKIKNFRNYQDLDIKFNKNINIIYGNNAQGKTNLLEAIYFLALTKSHRLNIDNSLIKNGTDTAYISGIIQNSKNISKYEIGFNLTTKKLKINNEQIKKVSNYISKINIIIFYPEDLNIIKGSPRERRRFLNLELSQIYSDYIDVLNNYNKLLKMRNNVLKQGIKDQHYFDVLTEYLVNRACDLYIMRHKFIDRLNEFCPKIYKNIIKLDGFHLEYSPNIKIDNYERDNLKKIIYTELQKTKEVEKRLGMTIIGPHKDDFIILLDYIDLRSYGSQGQQRAAILAIKLAELKIFETYQNVHPILLLDDVFSELDKYKKNNLLKYISKKNQVIITTTELNNIDSKILDVSEKIKIKDGKVVKFEEVKNG